MQSFQLKILWHEARSWNHPLHQIWPHEWNIINQQLNWQIFMLMLKLPALTGGRDRWLVCAAASADTIPTPDTHWKKKPETTHPRMIIDAFSCCRRMGKLGEWTFKQKNNPQVLQQQSYFRIWWRQKGVLRVPSSKHSGGLNPLTAFYPWLSRISLVLGPQRVEGAAPTKDSRPQPVFALHLVLQISGDKKGERNNIQTSV